jgi:uncharacterized damage-inducible protein DinB
MPDKAQARKEEIISALIQARRKILDVAYTLPPDKRDEIFLGIWSVQDLLAHLIGWDYTNLDAVKSILEGEVPYFYEYRDRDWASYNALLVHRHKNGHYAELLNAAETSHAALTGFLASVPAEEFDKDHGVRFKRYKVTISRLLEAEAEDEQEHHRQIKEFAETLVPPQAGRP